MIPGTALNPACVMYEILLFGLLEAVGSSVGTIFVALQAVIMRHCRVHVGQWRCQSWTMNT